MRGLRKYLVISGLLLLAYLVAQYFKPVPTDWSPTYLKEDKIPFGTYILYQRIGDLFPGSELNLTNGRLYNTLKNKNYRQANLILLGSGIDGDKNDLYELQKFVSAGNVVFIAAYEMNSEFNKFFRVQTSSSFDYNEQKGKGINFTNTRLKSPGDYIFDKGLGDQYYSKFDTLRAHVLGRNNQGKANFLRYPMGKGFVYLLPNPQLLTNYNLLNPRGADYVSKVLSYLPISRTLLWDEFNTRGLEKDQSVLRVIFGNEHLRWAYYLALFGLVGFVLFEMKRRQRIIPIINPPENSSVAFVKVVGKVYYQQRDNRDIAIKKVSYLLEFIRGTYQLKTNDLNGDLEKQLFARGAADPETISALFKAILKINSGAGVSDEQLIAFNKLTEQFYKQAQS